MRENQYLDADLDDVLQHDTLVSRILEALEEMDAQTAQKLLDDYEKEYGKDEVWHLFCVDIAEQNSDPEEMLDALMEAEEYGVDGNELALRYARLCYMVGRPEDALTHLKDCKFEEDSEQEFYKTHLEAYCYMIAEDYKHAVQKLEDLLLETDDYRMKILAGLCYSRLNQMDRAMEYLQEGLEKRDEFPPDFEQTLSAFAYDPDLIMLHSQEVFDQLAGTRAAADIPLGGMLDTLQHIENVRDLPDTFFEQFAEVLEQDSDMPMICCLQGIQASRQNDMQKARKLWRKAVTAEFKEVEAEDVLNLFFRFEALDCLDYTHKTVAKYLWQYWEAYDSAFVRGQLINFASRHNMRKTLYSMVKDKNAPRFNNRQEAAVYNMERAKALFNLEEFERALSLVKSLWADLKDDEEYLTLASSLAVISFDEPLLNKVAKILMPHGLIAFHLMEYYDMTSQPAKCRKVQKDMKEAMEDPETEVPDAQFYREFLKSFQLRHKR